jgi:hypothetical protein
MPIGDPEEAERRWRLLHGTAFENPRFDIPPLTDSDRVRIY